MMRLLNGVMMKGSELRLICCGIGLILLAGCAAETAPSGGREPVRQSQAGPHRDLTADLAAAVGAAVYQDPVTGIEFVLVAGGCFMMGDDGGEDHVRPTHSVCLDDFWIARYELTQGQWSRLMGSNPSRFQGSERPVEMVSWNDAREFLVRAKDWTGLDYRLPTEAEWEFAGIGGKLSRGDVYAGSNQADEVAWYSRNSDGETHPVGRKKPNELGLYDMSGNVWEWCADWYDPLYYRASPRYNPKGAEEGFFRVRRGGSWLIVPDGTRPRFRRYGLPGDRHDYQGFRPAITPIGGGR
ncbi:MAG: formylglycine-generating enzyme family protein [Proteobacteria bacterium]|nr:formylglycine-generating enzyme family protein [Pseudomonadota bacterium]MBU1736684.1 formylglycine-generating enzyme family protein [Pseudomonadota bacterium]